MRCCATSSGRSSSYLQEELEIYFDDISDAAERIWDTLENYKEVVEALESTNEAVLSHRLNDSLRVLTVGERRAPAADADREHLRHERAGPGTGRTGVAFLGIMAFMAVLLVLLVAYFRRRGWL